MTLREQADPIRFGLQPNGRYMPGRAEIERVCAEIRSQWSANERIKRKRWARTMPVTLREISIPAPGIRIFDR
jgi:hypothetical protein